MTAVSGRTSGRQYFAPRPAGHGPLRPRVEVPILGRRTLNAEVCSAWRSVSANPNGTCRITQGLSLEAQGAFCGEGLGLGCHSVGGSLKQNGGQRTAREPQKTSCQVAVVLDHHPGPKKQKSRGGSLPRLSNTAQRQRRRRFPRQIAQPR